MNYVLGKRILNILNHVIFPRKYKYRCIRVYVWFKDDKHVIWMWIWLILKNISLLDRIWSLWLVHFTHPAPSFIFWLSRLIFSVSINSHSDSKYISVSKCFFTYLQLLAENTKCYLRKGSVNSTKMWFLTC